MEKSYDDLLAISNLVLTLNQRVNDSAEYITKLQAITREIAPRKDSNDTAKAALPASHGSDEVEDEIRKLEQERIALVMDIQKQDFVSEKLIELIEQNQEMLESVKEYLQARESIRIEEEVYTKRDIEVFVTEIIRPTREQLRENSQNLHTRIGKLTEKLISIELGIQKEPALLQSEQYRKEVNLLVNAFKQLLKE
ncbi:hypothetical protein Cantr_06629 [Candida viswanathii]|uniref:Uncharacterized protein n=1 Tax=Candida viswanathii TaxID=5486 RepID=A0A367XZB4_9ASCO|nr:hypothetical protein Cantr_06629 [Candida viswanathii]